jgi:hypothetical protein
VKKLRKNGENTKELKKSEDNSDKVEIIKNP